MKGKSTLDNFTIIKTLGTGYTGKVKLGRDTVTGELYALKILDPSRMDAQKVDKVLRSLETELRIMKDLDHTNIIKFKSLITDGLYKSHKGVEKRVAYSVIELAGRGEIFEVLFKIGPLNENISRFYFKQLINAIEYLHNKNIAHRDLKPENLLIDNDLNIKLADFGFATVFEESLKNKTKLGTELYMCPELLYKKPYSATKADIFAAGVILFIFYSGHPPFKEAKMEDAHYNVFKQKRSKFWEFHSTQNHKKTYSNSFKELVSGMLEYDPDKRFSIERIKSSKWFNEPLDSDKALADMSTYVDFLNVPIKESNDLLPEDSAVANIINQTIDISDNQQYSDDPLTEFESINARFESKSDKGPNVSPVKHPGKSKLFSNAITFFKGQLSGIIQKKA